MRSRIAPEESRRLDLNAAEAGIPPERLMARAGKGLASAVLSHVPAGGEAWFLCGKGNNGGDGFAAASLLIGRIPVRVLLIEPKEAVQGTARAFLASLPEERVERWSPRLRPGVGPDGGSGRIVLVDCLLGTGATGAPRAPYDKALRWLAARKEGGHPVVACDIPSALGHRSAVVPRTTVTFHAAKEGMTRANSGKVIVVDIGIPPEVEQQIGLGDLAVAMGRTDPDAHKGDHGRVLVVAGGPYCGAPWYCAMGAARTGADLVHIATPSDAARIVATWGPTPLVHATEEGDRFTMASLPSVERLLGHVGAVVVGPGLGRHAETLEFARRVLDAVARKGLPVVIDADGLDAVTPGFLRRHGRSTVLTPHAGEFRDLTGIKKPTDEDVIGYAGKHRVVVARKGRIDLVTDGKTTRYCHCGHPTMTAGGTGDTLAGSIGALMARGVPPLQAACAGTYILGSAGEVAGALLGLGAQATDVHEAIPSVLLRLPRS